MKKPLWILACLMTSLLLSPQANGHTQLGTPLKKRYELRLVSCTACHLKEHKEKSREHLTPFGADIVRILEGTDYTNRLEAAKKLESDERKAALEQLEADYLKALDKLDKMTAPSGKPYSEALPAGELEGTRGK